MSICGGVAGKRGKNPVGIFIHNDAGSQSCTAEHYKTWLTTHDLANGFAHYYVCSDATLQAEDDAYGAWHCAQTDGNTNYLSIEVCQSYGDETIFRENEEKAFKLAAEKCKQYGITPSITTIKLHKEVKATACPHRSVELHGGDAATKQYFIDRINYYLGNTTTTTSSTTSETETGEEEMKCFYTIDGNAPVYYFDGTESHPLKYQDEMTIINKVYKDCNGKDIPCYSWSSKAPWYTRLLEGVSR